MILHSFLTDNYFTFSKMYLKSFKKFNGEDTKIVITSMGLNDKQISKMRELYKNIVIEELKYDYQELADLLGVSVQEARSCKREFMRPEEATRGNEWRRRWKLYISAKTRYAKVLPRIINKYNEPVLHTDIDIFFRSDISSFLKWASNYDVAIKTRLINTRVEDVRENRVFKGNFIYFSPTSGAKIFMKEWVHELDIVPLKTMLKGYGQTSILYAYNNIRDKVNFGFIPLKYVAATSRHQAPIWEANSGTNQFNLKRYRKDLKVETPEVEPFQELI